MKHRFLVVVVIVCSITLAIFMPRLKSSPQVDYQHELWPGETAEASGFQADGSLISHLPLIILHTEGNTIPGADYHDLSELLCSYSVIDNHNGVNSSNDVPILQGNSLLSIRGNSSRYLPKKQYSLKLIDESGLPDDVSLLGLPAESIWVLNGSHIDHSLIRNYLAYSISGEIMEYAPRTRLCEVFLTDNQGTPVYQGVYTLIEKPKVSDRRLNLPPYDPQMDQTSFLVQMNTRFDLEKNIYVNHNPIQNLAPRNIPTENLALEYPDEAEIPPSVMSYVQKQVYLFDWVLYESIHTGNWSIVESHLNVNSFVDYYLINEFFQNFDAGRLSTYSYQSAGGKMAMGPVWDFDGAMNNFYHEIPIEELGMHRTFYYGLLLQNKEFTDLCIQRYYQLRQTSLSDQHLLEFIDSASSYLGSAAERNCDLWYGGGSSEFDQDIQKMKTFVVERGAWMDENFETMIRLDQ